MNRVKGVMLESINNTVNVTPIKHFNPVLILELSLEGTAKKIK